MAEVYPNNLGDVDKIELLDGSSGERRIVEDKSEITNFINPIKDIQLTPHENQEGRVGFKFSISLYVGEERIIGFTPSNISGTYIQQNAEFEQQIQYFFERHYDKEF